MAPLRILIKIEERATSRAFLFSVYTLPKKMGEYFFLYNLTWENVRVCLKLK